MSTDKSATISLADEEAVKDVLVNTVFGLWDIVNNLTRLKPSKRERYRVTIFGSARAKPGTFVYDERLSTESERHSGCVFRTCLADGARPGTHHPMPYGWRRPGV